MSTDPYEGTTTTTPAVDFPTQPTEPTEATLPTIPTQPTETTTTLSSYPQVHPEQNTGGDGEQAPTNPSADNQAPAWLGGGT